MSWLKRFLMSNYLSTYFKSVEHMHMGHHNQSETSQSTNLETPPCHVQISWKFSCLYQVLTQLFSFRWVRCRNRRNRLVWTLECQNLKIGIFEFSRQKIKGRFHNILFDFSAKIQSRIPSSLFVFSFSLDEPLLLLLFGMPRIVPSLGQTCLLKPSMRISGLKAFISHCISFLREFRTCQKRDTFCIHCSVWLFYTARF